MKIILRSMVAMLWVSSAWGGVNVTALAKLNAAEAQLLRDYPAAMVQGELRQPNFALTGLGLTPIEAQTLSGLAGKDLFKNMKNTKVTAGTPLGLNLELNGSRVHITMIDNVSLLIEVGGNKLVWTPRFDVQKDYAALSLVMVGDPLSSRFSVIREAHAIGWIGVAVIAVIIAVGYSVIRATNKAIKKVSDNVNNKVDKVSNNLNQNIDKMGNKIDEATDKITKVADSVSNTIKDNSAAIGKIVDQSAATLAAAQAQVTSRVETASETAIKLVH